MKRITALLLALTIFLTLPGCAALPGETTAPEETIPAETAPPETAPEPVPLPALAITEVMPDNEGLWLGSEADWVEIYNPEDYAVDLSGWYLTDDPTLGTFLALSGYEIPGESYLAISLEGSFGLSAEGETVYLTHGLDAVSRLTFPAAQNGESFDADGPCPWVTPGYANTQEGYHAYLEARPLPELAITEVLAANTKHMPWRVGRETAYYDLVEVQNNGEGPLSLSGYGLSDKGGEPRYRFPAVTLAPGEYYVVYCSGDPSLGENHAPFKISTQGERVYLSKDGVLTDLLSVPGDLGMDESYGRLGKHTGYLEYPTFGADNAAAHAAPLAAPAADIPTGLYDEPVSVTLSGEGTIYYTTDGSRPTAKSRVYQEPISVTGVSTIRTYCVSGRRSSQIVSYTYVVGKDHDLPIVTVSIPNGYLNGSMGLLQNFQSKAEYEAVLTLIEDGEEKFTIPCGFRLHGNDSRKQYKKNFSLRFRKEYGAGKLEYKLFDDREIEEFDSILLKGGSEDWYKSMIRDELASAVAGSGTSLYTQATKPVVLYLGGRYFGIYYFRERFSDNYVASHLNVSPESVDIAYSNAAHRQFGDNTDFLALRTYVLNHDMRKDEHYQYLTERIDVQSLMDWYICRTFMGDGDTANIRRFRSLEYDRKWRWMFFDMDWGFNWMNDRPLSRVTNHGGDWTLMQAVLTNKTGRDAFLSRYAYLMDTALDPERINGLIDELIGSFESELARDRKRWGVSMDTWESEVAFIRQFVNKRRKYIINHLQSYFQLSSKEVAHYFGE